MEMQEQITPERDSAPFWRSIGGKLLVQACEHCGKNFHYPRPLCPFCASTQLNWVECSGRGEVYSFSIVRRSDPYVIAFVELAEGPRLLTNIVDCDVDAVRIGDAVSVVFHEVNGISVPMFRPDGDQH
jgi:hypothetical protein